MDIKKLRAEVSQLGGYLLNLKESSDTVLSGDGRFLAFQTNAVVVWDLLEKKQIYTAKNNKFGEESTSQKMYSYESDDDNIIRSIAITEDGKKLAISKYKQILIIDINSEKVLQRIPNNKSPITEHIVFNKTGDLLLVVQDEEFFVLDLKTVQILNSFDAPENLDGFKITKAITTDAALVSFIANCKLDSEKEFMLYWTPQQLTKFSLELTQCTTALSPDGEYIFVAGQNYAEQCVFQLFNNKGELLKEKITQDDSPTYARDLVWDSTGKRIAFTPLINDTWIIDVGSLDIIEVIQWPEITFNFVPNWIVITGRYNLVLPENQLKQLNELSKLDTKYWESYNQLTNFLDNSEHAQQMNDFIAQLNEITQVNKDMTGESMESNIHSLMAGLGDYFKQFSGTASKPEKTDSTEDKVQSSTNKK